MKSWLVVFLLVAACRREPSIVIRFDPPDAASDAAVSHDAAMSHDASMTRDAAMSAAFPAHDRACANDSECAVIPDGCCDCANGGKQRAIVVHNKRDKMNATVSALKDPRCAGVMCTMMVSTDPTCGKRPACVAGACTLREARPDEVKRPPPTR